MKLRRRLYFHSLKKGKVRQTWNKYNLYNLSKIQSTFPNFIRRTFFQQKWTAKSLARAYHGEHINERKWEVMFNRRLLSVVNMDPEYMAQNDGAEQAAGRGSGRDQPTKDDLTPWAQLGKKRRELMRGRLLERFSFPEKSDLHAEEKEAAIHVNRQEGTEGTTPYMNMTFAPQERRIDVAIFRALFASSVRQARQFVVHGAVKVNGQKMNHPSYLLNPGDMFQVEKDCVMLAAGKKKLPKVSRRKNKFAKFLDENQQKKAAIAEKRTAYFASRKGSGAAAEGAEADAGAEATPPETDEMRLKRRIRFLAKCVRSILTDKKLSVQENRRRQRRIRAFIASARFANSKLGVEDQEILNPTLLAAINARLEAMALWRHKSLNGTKGSGSSAQVETVEASADAPKEQAQKQSETGKEPDSKPAPQKFKSSRRPPLDTLNPQKLARLEKMIETEVENPVDGRKPYLTPWEPRPYMSAFAFIPRYLEVNQNICAAVYLRHPVARRGYAEVPSPFPPNVMQLAFNWYLRRR